MDGVHDLGGMHGFGRVEEERDEPVFHAAWEGRIFALLSATPYAAGFGDDQFRTAVERLEPGLYLASSYYAKWLHALVGLLEERGLLTAAELIDGGHHLHTPGTPTAPALAAKDVLAAIQAGASQARPTGPGAAPRFAVGEAVKTRSHGGRGHTRLPRYVRGRSGRIMAMHGPFLVADRNSVGDQTPETLYTVVFEQSVLWGDEAVPGDTLSLDLWDSYLESEP